MRTFNRWMFPVIAVLVLAFVLFPTHVLSAFVPRQVDAAPVGTEEVAFTVDVPGVT